MPDFSLFCTIKADLPSFRSVCLFVYFMHILHIYSFVKDQVIYSYEFLAPSLILKYHQIGRVVNPDFKNFTVDMTLHLCYL